MITNFKIFENYREYEIGDYIETYTRIHRQIWKRNAIINKIDKPLHSSYLYHIKYLDGRIPQNSIITGDIIRRHLTSKEIERIKINKVAKKFNI